MTSLNISDDYYNEIITEIGYPVLTIDGNETDIEMTKEQIIKLCILPSVREYWKWIPIISRGEYNVSSSFEIDFPDNQTFGITHASLNTLGTSSTSLSGNPYINSRYYSSGSGYYSGSSYGPYNYNTFRSRTIERIEKQSIVDSNKSFRVNVDLPNKKLVGYTNITGKLIVNWSKFSENFSDIPFRDLTWVIKLSQSYLLRRLGLLRGMQNSSTPNNFNFDLMLSESDRLREEVLTYFRTKTKVAVQKG